MTVVTNVSGCLAQAFGVAFASNSLALVWDNNCDALYQIDPGTHTQTAARSIATGRDSGAGGSASSRFAVSSATNLAYGVREDNAIAIMNPATLTFTNQGGFTDTPYAIAASPDGSKLYTAVIHRFTTANTPDTLDILDTQTTNFTRNAYTFTSTSASVVDMAVVSAP